MRILRMALPAAIALSGCASLDARSPVSPTVPALEAAGSNHEADPFASTYRPRPAPTLAIIHATILTAAGPRIEDGTVLLRSGRIEAVGKALPVPDDATVVDARGRYVTPGIIDPHSHIGDGPYVRSGGGSERGSSDPAAARVEHSIWAQDPMFDRILAAGVTTVHILPGSGNTINGRTVVLKNVPALDVRAMKFPGDPASLKLACGENPASRSGGRGGVVRAFRSRLAEAKAYAERRAEWQHTPKGAPPEIDPGLENIAKALSGELKVQWHCYRADDMRQMIAVAREAGMKIAAFHHANEAFKIARELADANIAVVTWAGDWSGYKMEAYDSIMETPAFIEKVGGVVAMHSDDPMLIQHLNQEAARSMTAGREAGIPITEEQAIRWITINPAKIIGVDRDTGSLEPGKMADILVWNTNPFSVYALPDLVYIDGALAFDRFAPDAGPRSDFELGNVRRPKPAAYPVPAEESKQ